MRLHSPGEWQLPLHLSYSTEWPALISDMEGTKSFRHEQNGSALTSDLLVRMAQSHLMMEDSQLQRGEISALTSSMEGTKSFSHEQNGPALISDLLVRMAMDLSTHINHGRNQSSHHVRMAMGIINFPWRKPRYGELQASP